MMVPLLCENVPVVASKLPAMVVVAVGIVTVPVATVKLFPTVMVEVENDQLPPTPLNERL